MSHFNHIRFEENISKTYHEGLFDLKYKPRLVKYVCHSLNEKHDHCLVNLYNLYIGLVSENAKEVSAFYFKPNCKKISSSSRAEINVTNAKPDITYILTTKH